jgi:uncharacterized membrane protein YdjX (TVP38/TMEM64 family)
MKKGEGIYNVVVIGAGTAGLVSAAGTAGLGGRRFIARERVAAIAQRNEKFREIDSAIGKQEAKLVFLLRLSPVIPFNLSSYLYGLTGVKFWPYVLASWAGMMPGTFLYVYIGTVGKAAVLAAGGEAVKQGWQYWTFISVGLVATIVVTIWVTKIARDALKKTADVKS